MSKLWETSMKPKLFNKCIKAMEEYLLDTGWTFNPETRLWRIEGEDRFTIDGFTLMHAFSTQSFIDFGRQYPN